MSSVRVYPNPVQNNILVDLNGVSETLKSIKVMDLTGRSVKELSGVKNGIVEIDFSSYASGVYSILLQGEQSTITKRVIKK